jgi:P-type Cu+ transporter
MDTLISVGVLAAYGWSLYALFFGDAGMPGMRMSFHLVPEAGGGSEIYLEVAAAVTTFILAGRYFEARAKRGRARRCARCWRWVPRTSRCCATAARIASPIDDLRSATASSCAPARRSPPTAWSSRARRPSTPACSPVSRFRSRSAGRPVTGATVNAGGRLVVRATRVGVGHPAGPDGPSRRGRAVGQGTRPAPRRPHLGRLRPDRDRPGRGDPRLLAGPGPVRSSPSPRPWRC